MLSKCIFKKSTDFKLLKDILRGFLILLLTLSITMYSVLAQPVAFIIVKNVRGEIVTYLVTVFAEGCVIKRLNVTHIAILVTHKTKVLVFKDGITVYETELNSLREQQVIEIVARLQHVTIHLPHIHSGLAIIKYGDVILSKFIKNGILELTNVPYPTNLTLEIPQMKYKVTLVYRGEEIIKVEFMKSSYNVYLRFYNILFKPLPTGLVKVVGAEVSRINETHIGLNLSKEVKLKILCYGVNVAEIKVKPSINQVRTINIRLPIGPLKVIAPKNSTITIILPSGKKLSKQCIFGKVTFDHIPACKLRLIVNKDQLEHEEIIEFPGILTINVTLKESKSSIDSSLSDMLSIISVILVSITLVVIMFRSKGKARRLYKYTNLLGKYRESIKVIKPRTQKASNRTPKIDQALKSRYSKLKSHEKYEDERKKRSLKLVDFKANDLADLINKLKKYRKELEKIEEQHNRL